MLLSITGGVPASLWLAGVCDPVRLQRTCRPPGLLLCLRACCTAMLLMPALRCMQVPVCVRRGADIAQPGAPSPAGRSCRGSGQPLSLVEDATDCSIAQHSAACSLANQAPCVQQPAELCRHGPDLCAE